MSLNDYLIFYDTVGSLVFGIGVVVLDLGTFSFVILEAKVYSMTEGKLLLI